MNRRTNTPGTRSITAGTARGILLAIGAVVTSSTLFLLMRAPARELETSGASRDLTAAAAARVADADLGAISSSDLAVASSTRNAISAEAAIHPPSPRVLSLALSTSPRTRLRVVNDHGSPVADAEVEVWRKRPGEGPEVTEEYLNGRTDAHGEFFVEGGWTVLGAVAWSRSSTARPVSENAFTPEVELVLHDSRTVRGVVRDAVSGLPIADAEISLWTHARRDTVRSVEDGTFRHPRLPSGGPRQQVRATARGYAPRIAIVECDELDGTRSQSGARDPERVHGRGADAHIEFSLWPEASIRGKVTDPGGAPIAGARVRAEGYALMMSGAASADAAEARTNLRGEYEVRGLRPDVSHALLVEAPTFAARLVELPADEEQVVDVQLESGASIVGQLLDPSGAPAEGVRIELKRLDAPKPASGGPDSARARGLGRRTSCATDAAGAFALDCLGSHRYELRVMRGPEPLIVREIAPSLGESLAVPPLHLDAKWLTLRGTVDPNGLAIRVTGSRVEIWQGQMIGVVHVEADGTFRVAGLSTTAEYELRWYSADDSSRLLGATNAQAYDSVRLCAVHPPN